MTKMDYGYIALARQFVFNIYYSSLYNVANLLTQIHKMYIKITVFVYIGI